MIVNSTPLRTQNLIANDSIDFDKAKDFKDLEISKVSIEEKENQSAISINDV
jgi:hypothetical protein